jgi:hypothetical protein
MKFVELTTPNGEPVSVAPDQICAFAPAGHDQAKGARTVLRLANGQQQAVAESYDAIKAALGS